MALRRQGLFVALICGAGAISTGTLGWLAYRQGPLVTSEVCANCGLFRTRTSWRVPKTSMGVFWRSAKTNSAVSIAIHDHNLAREWRHHWLIYDEIRPAPVAAPPVARGGSRDTVFSPPPASAPLPPLPGKTLVYQYNSPDVAKWIIALGRRSDEKRFAKWMRWLADPNLSPHVLGTAVRYCLLDEQLKERQAFQAWLDQEEEKLVFGRRPKTE